MHSEFLRHFLEQAKPDSAAYCGEDVNAVDVFCRYAQSSASATHLIVTDPSDKIFDALRRSKVCPTLHQSSLIDAIGRISHADAVIFDAEPNWYGTMRQLLLIANGFGSREPIIIVIGMQWPYGRRDFYPHPESIPSAFIHASNELGIIPGKSEAPQSGGFFAGKTHATEEGTAKNGVLTAVEDFVRTNSMYSPPLFASFADRDMAILVPTSRRQDAISDWLKRECLSDQGYRQVIAIRQDFLLKQDDNRIYTERERLRSESEMRHHREITDRLRSSLSDIEAAYRASLESGQTKADILSRELLTLRDELQSNVLQKKEIEKQLLRVFATKSWRWSVFLRNGERLVRRILSFVHNIPFALFPTNTSPRAKTDEIPSADICRMPQALIESAKSREPMRQHIPHAEANSAFRMPSSDPENVRDFTLFILCEETKQTTATIERCLQNTLQPVFFYVLTPRTDASYLAEIGRYAPRVVSLTGDWTSPTSAFAMGIRRAPTRYAIFMTEKNHLSDAFIEEGIRFLSKHPEWSAVRPDPVTGAMATRFASALILEHLPLMTRVADILAEQRMHPYVPVPGNLDSADYPRINHAR